MVEDTVWVKEGYVRPRLGLIVMVSAALLLADVIISYVDPSSQLFSLGT